MPFKFFGLLTLSIASVQCFSPVTKNVRMSTSVEMMKTEEEFEPSSRRNFLSLTGSTVLATASLLTQPETSMADTGDYSNAKVLVLGGSGFVGSEVCKQLKALGVEYITTSRDGRGDTKALDFTNSAVNIPNEVESLAKGCTAVISCIGAIGTPADDVVNSGTGLAALGAKAAGVENFVYISVAPEVRESAKGVSFLNKYMEEL